MSRSRSLVVCLSLLSAVAGCHERGGQSVTGSASASAVPPHHSRLLADVPTCTGDTRLVPGVPGSPGHLIADSVNPNGTSELALLMRTLRRDLATVRQAVLAGEPARIPFEHHRIRCAWPTVPADRNERFDVLALEYLRSVDTFNAQSGPREFDAVVQRCITCHEGACSGALAAIRPLLIAAPSSE